MIGVENETDKKSKLRAIQDWTTERIGDVRYMVNRCITYENKRILNMEVIFRPNENLCLLAALWGVANGEQHELMTQML